LLALVTPHSNEQRILERLRALLSKRAVFLDLNGTLVEPLKPDRPAGLTLIPNVAQAVARLSAAGFLCPVITVCLQEAAHGTVRTGRERARHRCDARVRRR